MEERRQYVRINDPVKVTHRFPGTILGGSSASADLSGGGLSFPAFQNLEAGTALDLDITLSGFRKPILALGRVVWRDLNSDIKSKFMVGVKFTRIDPSDRKTIIDYVNSLLRRQRFKAQGREEVGRC